jgi:drug/metabolite transporter (DMT)-like permease
MSILLIPILLTIDSLHFIFARLLHPLSPPEVSVLFVLLIATIEVGLFGAQRRELDLIDIKRKWWLFAVIGVLIAASTVINYQAVEFIDPGIASLLAQTGAVWAVFFGLIWLREDLNRTQAIGGVLALSGVFIVNYKAGDYVQLGSLLVVLSAALYAFHSALTKKFSEDIGLTTFFFARLVTSTAAIFLFSAFSGTLAWPSKAAWPFILLAGTIDVAVSRYLYYFALRKVKLTVLTIILTLSPVVAILWSVFLFKSRFSTQESIGGIIVLIGVLIVGLRRQRKTREVNVS